MSCNNINTPQVDNSEIECNGTNRADCVFYVNAIGYLGLPENSSLTEVVDALLASLIDARQRITALENQ